MMMKNRWTRYSALLLSLVLAVGLFAGCGNNNDNNNAKNSNGSNANSQSSNQKADDAAKKTEYPLVLTDASGKEITFDKAPERIASIAPSLTEVLFALGLGDEVVAVDDYSDYPEEAKTKTKVGGMELNAEALIAADPNVVFGGYTLNKASVEKLRGLNKTVFTVEPKTIDETIDSILTIGKIMDVQAQAEKVVADMRADVKQVTDAVAGLKDTDKKKVYIEFSPGWTVGKGEFMDNLLTIAGGINVAADTQGWTQISEEKIIQDNPDVILYSKAVPDLEKTIVGRAGWDKIAAVQNKQLIALDDSMISRPGPRITKALIDVAKAIYPDLVK